MYAHTHITYIYIFICIIYLYIYMYWCISIHPYIYTFIYNILNSLDQRRLYKETWQLSSIHDPCLNPGWEEKVITNNIIETIGNIRIWTLHNIIIYFCLIIVLSYIKWSFCSYTYWWISGKGYDICSSGERGKGNEVNAKWIKKSSSFDILAIFGTFKIISKLKWINIISNICLCNYQNI